MNEQHPSLDGDIEQEIARRSPDGADGHHWFRELVHRILPGHHFDPDTMDHTANLAGAAQAAIQAGVHPKGAPFFVGARPHETAPDNVVLTYAVPVVPSVIDKDPESTVTPTMITLAAQEPATSADSGSAAVTAVQAPEGASVTADPGTATNAAPQPETTS